MVWSFGGYMSRRVKINVGLIVIFGFVIRLIGFKHGFPFIFHIDEPALVRSALELRFFPNPGHFDWPHLHYYLNFGIYQLFIWARAVVQNVGLKEFFMGLFPVLWRDPLIFYYLSRALNAFLGALTIIPVFLIGKILFNSKVGTLSALAFCLIPYHVHASHFALIDVPMIFWGAWSLYFSTKVYKSGLLRDYVLAGFFVGLSASTKYNGVFFCIFVVFAHILLCLEKEEYKLFSFDTVVKLFSAGLFSIFGFLLGTPYSVLDYETFIDAENPTGAFWQFRSFGEISFWAHVRQFFEVLSFKFDQDFGFSFIYIYTIFSFTFFFFKRFRKNAALWFLIVPSLFLVYYMTGSERMRTHYYMFLYIFISLIVGFVTSTFTPMTKRDLNNIFVALVMLIPMTLSLHRVYLLVQKDTRTLLYGWMTENVKETDLLIYDSNDVVPVVEKFSKNRTEEVSEEDEMPLELLDGYLVFVVERDFFMEHADEMVFATDAVNRRGPPIWVYTIK